MMIRNCTTKTLKASSLHNRGVRSTPGCQMVSASTLEGSPFCGWGTPLECTTANYPPAGGARCARTLGYGAKTALRSLCWYDGGSSLCYFSCLLLVSEWFPTNHVTISTNHDTISANHDAISANHDTISANHGAISAKHGAISAKQ